MAIAYYCMHASVAIAVAVRPQSLPDVCACMVFDIAHAMHAVLWLVECRRSAMIYFESFKGHAV